jgi:hypothetical protein
MVNHLQRKADNLIKTYSIKAGDTIIDIGSNDGTLLNAFPKDTNRIGFDPTIKNFEKYYEDGIKRIPQFFELSSTTAALEKNKLITSIAMFYDLPEPLEFATSVANALDPVEGVWHFEQAYWPETVRTLGYDTICHEHLEYYSLTPIIYLLNKINMKIIELSFNSINGGSFSITAAKNSSKYPAIKEDILDWYVNYEQVYLRKKTLDKFNKDSLIHAQELNKLLNVLKNNGNNIAGLGASTKGNVLLQKANITSQLLDVIGEVNQEKFGKYTPGTKIKIVNEIEVLNGDYQYIIVLPWHFKEGILEKIKKSKSEAKIIFPLPTIQVI